MNNLYLCGFMGCGKSTVGRITASMMGKEFLDSDNVITDKYGEISGIFAQRGEEGFRAIETEVLKELANEDGRIIALGGGAVTREENVRILKASGKIVFIDTPFNICAMRILGDKTRPLTAGGRDELEKLYASRAGVYSKCANITLQPCKTPKKTAEKIVRLFYGDSINMLYNMCVTKPQVFLTADANGFECADELLFGNRLRILDENSTGVERLRCETDYGYRGFVKVSDIAEIDKQYKIENEKTVFTTWCDILPTPEYKGVPYMTLPKGSKVEIVDGGNDRFRAVKINGGVYYARKECFDNPFATLPIGDRIVCFAKSYLETPYRWGGKSQNGIDCSGLVFMAHRLSGKTVYRDAVMKNEYVFEIEENQLEAGDIIYFKGHVAIYIGNQRIIHATASNGNVAINDLKDLKIEPIAYARAR